MIEGGPHSINNEGTERHLEMGWELSAQYDSGGSRLAGHMVSSRFVGNSHV